MDPFLTTYRKDYSKKTAVRPGQKEYSEFKDPVGEAFKNYLQLSSAKEPAEPPIENADTYLEKHAAKYPRHAELYFQTPINNEEVTRTFVYNGRSVYQVDYCDLQKDEEYKAEVIKRNLFRLPDDVYIPLTTNKYTHRNPLVINSRAMEKVKQNRVPNNLDPSARLREILKVTTGKTEYSGVIGEIGEIIMNDEVHGKRVLA